MHCNFPFPTFDSFVEACENTKCFTQWERLEIAHMTVQSSLDNFSLQVRLRQASMFVFTFYAIKTLLRSTFHGALIQCFRLWYLCRILQRHQSPASTRRPPLLHGDWRIDVASAQSALWYDDGQLNEFLSRKALMHCSARSISTLLSRHRAFFFRIIMSWLRRLSLSRARTR